jgi:membrane glycosyltransferase
VWVAEESAFLGLRERTRGHGRIFYRRRPKNLERKAGNIADWCRRWGGAYAHMLVLDADSLMTGEAIVRLAAAMEAHPDVGLIQTLPLIVNRNTLFARLQQFAGRIYGPVIAAGISWWHGADSNYWGHNAVIRTRTFVDTAGLPHIKGKPPFGGHILSHDFVEAALLRRAGWAVHLVPQLGGSYEESPPSLIDLAVRDRRWCQGNLQHMAVLPARGLYWMSRVHLLMGIMSYLASPLWLLFLVGGMLLALQARFFRPEYFTSEFSLFPVWPAIDPVRAAWLFAGSMFILLAPKLLGYIHAMSRPELRHGSGGPVGAFLSMILETLISGLIAPVMMVIQSVAVFEILTGRAVGWNPQRRDDGSIPLRDVAWRHLQHTLFGFILAGCAYAVSPLLFLWMTPVIVGLVVSIPLSALTARRDLGRWLRRQGLLLIPEEVKPPRVIALANVLTRQLQAEAPAEREAVRRLAQDPDLLAAHLAMLPPKPPRRRCEIDVDLVTGLAKAAEALTLEEALQALTAKEKAAVLADAGGTERLVGLARVERQTEPALALV